LQPKCGFIPDFGDEVRRAHTRFEMHQHYKKQLGAIRKISKYDPLDLFSKDLMRIRRALDSMTENPQNSFRVFVNGEYAFGDKKMATEGFENGAGKLHAVEERIPDFWGGMITDIAVEERIPDFWEGMITDILSLAIYEDDTMQRILNLQRNDDMGIHKIYEHYEALGEPVINIVDVLTDESGRFPHEFMPIAKWLMAQTAKDFSVMVSFCEVDPSSIQESEAPKNVIKHNSRYFAWQSFVVDADPKSGKKIPYYVDMDEKIVDAFCRATGY
jgi:inositol-pentakisphosphate 2-kinase